MCKRERRCRWGASGFQCKEISIMYIRIQEQLFVGMLFGGLGCPHFFPDLMLVGDSVFGVLESGGGSLAGGRCGGRCRGQHEAKIALLGQQPTAHDLSSAHEVGRGHEGVVETLAHVGKQ